MYKPSKQRDDETKQERDERDADYYRDLWRDEPELKPRWMRPKDENK